MVMSCRTSSYFSSIDKRHCFGSTPSFACRRPRGRPDRDDPDAPTSTALTELVISRCELQLLVRGAPPGPSPAGLGQVLLDLAPCAPSAAARCSSRYAVARGHALRRRAARPRSRRAAARVVVARARPRGRPRSTRLVPRAAAPGGAQDLAPTAAPRGRLRPAPRGPRARPRRRRQRAAPAAASPPAAGAPAAARGGGAAAGCGTADRGARDAPGPAAAPRARPRSSSPPALDDRRQPGRALHRALDARQRGQQRVQVGRLARRRARVVLGRRAPDQPLHVRRAPRRSRSR